MNEQVFKLYISGESEASRMAMKHIKNYISCLNRTNIYLEIIDITKSYEAALAEKIFTTPTLIWKSEGKKLRFFGDFSDIGSYLI